MINVYEIEDILNDPKWKDDVLVVEFTFRGGLSKSVAVDVSELSPDEVRGIRSQILGKRKLIQSIFEHDTHGQITVQGLTVRADDLIAVSIK